MHYSNNSVKITGMLVDEPRYSHSSFIDTYYKTHVSIKRLSGTKDTIQVVIPQRLLDTARSIMLVGNRVTLNGYMRSSNVVVDGKSKLLIYVSVKDISPTTSDEADQNRIEISGNICKPPIARKSGLGKDIVDIMIAVKNTALKTSYIPCIAWGSVAGRVAQYNPGDEISIIGMIHSRRYKKYQPDSTFKEMTAYELSAFNVMKRDKCGSFGKCSVK